MAHQDRSIAFQFQAKAPAASPLDQWTKRLDETERMVSDAVRKIAERESVPPSLPRERQRRTAEIRRKVAIVQTRMGFLHDELSHLPTSQHIRPIELSELAEKLSALDSKVKEVSATFAMKHSSIRDDLLGPSEDCIKIDIDSLAEKDNREIVDVQRKIMKEQDSSLDKLEETIASTKHIALAINEELDLHTRLIDDLDERTDDTNKQLQRVQRRLKSLTKRITESGSMMHILYSVIAFVICVAIAAWVWIKYW